MLKKHTFNTLTGLLFFYTCSVASWADQFPQPQPLSISIQKSQIIVLATLVNFKPDEDNVSTLGDSLPQSGMGSTGLHPPGLYNFDSIKVLKGNLSNESRLQLHLPAITGFYYGSNIPLPLGSKVLLLLNKTNNRLAPIDETTPVVPLGLGAIPLLPPERTSELRESVVRLMLSTLDDPSIRKVNMHLLRTIESNQLPLKLTPLENDPDLSFRDDVLYCLIVNQEVKAIPLMAQLSEVRLKENGGAASVGSFEYLKTKKAVPYLNPLLLNVSPFTRQSAAFALRRLADATSINYLFEALNMSLPDPQGITVYEEYATLHRLVPRLGTMKPFPYFLDHKETILKATHIWWSKHEQEFSIEAVPTPQKS